RYAPHLHSFPTRRSSDLYRFELRPSLEAGLKYLVLSAAASSFLLFGMALLYAESGTLIFATLGAQLAPGQLDNPVILTGVLMMRSEEHTSELQSRENLVC